MRQGSRPSSRSATCGRSRARPPPNSRRGAQALVGGGEQSHHHETQQGPEEDGRGALEQHRGKGYSPPAVGPGRRACPAAKVRAAVSPRRVRNDRNARRGDPGLGARPGDGDPRRARRRRDMPSGSDRRGRQRERRWTALPLCSIDPPLEGPEADLSPSKTNPARSSRRGSSNRCDNRRGCLVGGHAQSVIGVRTTRRFAPSESRPLRATSQDLFCVARHELGQCDKHAL